MTMTLASPQVLAEKSVTLMQLSDVHGHLHTHPEIFPDGRIEEHAGGIAKLTTLINEVREDAPDSLLLAVGDTTHGSAEMLFSLGDLIMPWLNSLGIDAFTPGNWDFGWGPRVYRQRFTPANPPLAPNNRTTIAWMDGMDPLLEGQPGREDQTCDRAAYNGSPFVPASLCSVTKANFDTVAMNVYNFDEYNGALNPAQPLGPLVHPPYKIMDVNKVKVAIMGLTSDVVPQQAQAFNTSFRFTMGYKEMPKYIAEAKAAGAELIVVLSELGLAKNVQMVKEFPEIDVMFSGHTHERTPEAIVIEHADNTISLVTEAGEDSFLGRLDLKLTSNGKISKYDWTLLEADEDVDEDGPVADMVKAAQHTFVSEHEDGDPGDPQCHTFGVNAFPFGKGHTLCDPLDDVIGHTEVTIKRFDALEDEANNVMVDAFKDLATSLGESDSKLNTLDDSNTLSTTNGFRFDAVILGSDDGYSGDITIGDLYDYYPIGAATGLAEYTGGRIKLHWEGILNNVFDPNPYRQRGGWFLGFTDNMHFDLQLNDNYPTTISAGKRIASVTIEDVEGGMGPKRIDDSKIYTLASCYPHGNPVDEVCRTAGATNLRFITAIQEDCDSPATFSNGVESCQLDVTSDGNFSVKPPVNTANIFDPVRFCNGDGQPCQTGPLFLKVAPDDFVHPVDALRRYFGILNVVVNEDKHGLGRVEVVGADPGDERRGVPVSEYGGPGIVQPTQGIGPAWEKREFVQ
jgi:2',3'-cyclic-nucleotide 2'-phosphodiesterase (5'-nucleotidase family)